MRWLNLELLIFQEFIFFFSKWKQRFSLDFYLFWKKKIWKKKILWFLSIYFTFYLSRFFLFIFNCYEIEKFWEFDKSTIVQVNFLKQNSQQFFLKSDV